MTQDVITRKTLWKADIMFGSVRRSTRLRKPMGGPGISAANIVRRRVARKSYRLQSLSSTEKRALWLTAALL